MEDENNTERFSPKVIKIAKLIGGFVLLLVLIGIFFGGHDKNAAPEEEKQKTADEQTTRKAKFNLTNNKKGLVEGEKVKEEPPVEGIIPSEVDASNKKEEPKPDLKPEPEKPDLLKGPVPVQVEQEKTLTAQEQWELDTINQINQRRRQQFFDATVKPIAVNGMQTEVNSNGVSNGIGNYEPNNQYSVASEQDRVRAEIARTEAQLASMQGGTGSGGSTSTTVLDVSDYNGSNGSTTSSDGYGSMSKKDGWSLGNSLQALSNPYTVIAGTVLPAVMISGINSDLPGQIMGQVSQNVYDTATGHYLLIPQGTRLIGTYGSETAYGQERVMIAWQRLVYPDGRTLDLGAMPGSDSAGYSGFTDQVNNHWWKLMSSAFLMSGIVAAVAISVDDKKSNNNNNNSNSSNMTDTMRTALASQFGTVVAQVIQRNLNVSPTLEIRPGYKFNVMVTKDIKFDKTYELFN